MESSLHHQLKAQYVPDQQMQEVRIGRYRVDGIAEGRLIEIQCASLASIRTKLSRLLVENEVCLVKPLATRKSLVTFRRKGGPAISSRYSPLRAGPFDLFDELVHLAGVFPHPQLSLEVLLVEMEEHRVKCVQRRRNRKNYRVLDRVLRNIAGRIVLERGTDLLRLLPGNLPEIFTTADLARCAGIPRWLSQKAAYCLRKSGAVLCVARRGRLRLYRKTDAKSPCDAERQAA